MKAVLGTAEVKYMKTAGVSAIVIEVMPPSGQEALQYKQLVQFLHGEKVMVSIAPDQLKDEASGILEA